MERVIALLAQSMISSLCSDDIHTMCGCGRSNCVAMILKLRFSNIVAKDNSDIAPAVQRYFPIVS